MHAVGHAALSDRGNHAVVPRHLIPGRLLLPSWVRDGLPEYRSDRRLLRHGHHERFVDGQVLAEALVELVLPDPDIPVRVPLDVPERWGRKPLANLINALTGVGSECSDVHEPNDVRYITGLCDNRPAIGMTAKQDRPVDLLDPLPRALGGVREGRQWILQGVQRAVAATVQLDDDFGPMCSAAPKAMHEYDAWLVAHSVAPSNDMDIDHFLDSLQRGLGAHGRNGPDTAVDREVCPDDVRRIVRREVNCQLRDFQRIGQPLAWIVGSEDVLNRLAPLFAWEETEPRPVPWA